MQPAAPQATPLRNDPWPPVVSALPGSATCCGVPKVTLEPETVKGTASGWLPLLIVV